jgi:hypothetical protein
MIVYRVQNRKGVGPYGGLGREYSPDLAACDPGAHPSPEHSRPVPRNDFCSFHDGDMDTFSELTRGGAYRYAFPSLKALFAWFSKEHLKEMAQAGFKVWRLKVDDVLVSDSGWQCIYRAAKSR